MASIRAFRGVRYDRARIPDLSRVVTQPYDRIGPELQSSYYDLDPHNYVRLILNRRTPQDAAGDDTYTRARDALQQWSRDGIVVRDLAPALYVYHQTFPMADGSLRTRRAFLAVMRLAAFDEGIVLPHERTLSGPKADRLNLFRATGANLEPVFLLYPDQGNRINHALDQAISDRPPDADVHELLEGDVRQQMWVVDDPGCLARVSALAAPMRKLIVADGHHRYETALNYRNEMRAARPADPPDAPYNFVLAAFVNMFDPGLVILPTHRLVHSYGRLTAGELLSLAARYFAITQVPDRAALLHGLAGGVPSEHRLGFVTRDRCYLWILQDGAVMDTLAPERAAWRELDVSILHELVLEKLLGLSKDSITRKENLEYLRDPAPGFEALDRGEAEFLFLLNPTRMAQIAACATVGERMPQKSTDFYPKMISGLVLFPLLD